MVRYGALGSRVGSCLGARGAAQGLPLQLPLTSGATNLPLALPLAPAAGARGRAARAVRRGCLQRRGLSAAVWEPRRCSHQNPSQSCGKRGGTAHLLLLLCIILRHRRSPRFPIVARRCPSAHGDAAAAARARAGAERRPPGGEPAAAVLQLPCSCCCSAVSRR